MIPRIGWRRSLRRVLFGLSKLLPPYLDILRGMMLTVRSTHLELDPRAPFGGHKESGVGFEWSAAGLKAYCNSQTLYLKKKA